MCKLLVPMGTTSVKTMYKYYDLDLLHIYDVFIDKKTFGRCRWYYYCMIHPVYIYRNHVYMTRSIDLVYVPTCMIYIIHNSTHVLYKQIKFGIKWCWKSIKSICHQSDLLLMDLKFSRNINFSLRTTK
jgi:hypothetical protein